VPRTATRGTREGPGRHPKEEQDKGEQDGRRQIPCRVRLQEHGIYLKRHARPTVSTTPCWPAPAPARFPGTMETPDTGQESNLQAQVIAASVVMLALSTVAVALRFYTRRVVLGVLSADDCVILVALVCSILARCPLPVLIMDMPDPLSRGHCGPDQTLVTPPTPSHTSSPLTTHETNRDIFRTRPPCLAGVGG
jgi:hypothetical protein